jgi:hypothetical protein
MKLFRFSALSLAALSLVAGGTATMFSQATAAPASTDRLSFQTHAPWSPRINLNADTVMVYGIDDTTTERIESWRARGYTVNVMTGVAWGHYADYLNGEFDGKKHWDEAQTQSDGKMVLHGKDVPYISPGEDYGRYLSSLVRKALDAGASAIFLEEPEFWAKSGWSDSFKREWKSYYGEDWLDPDSSPDAQYRASKLKYFLYRRALSQVFDSVREYGREHKKTIPCYVATHSLLNYAQWQIVSPESSLLKVGADGYIAQVWTGTAREPNVYEGKRKERTFETAFLEYGAMQNLVRASGRRVWYLNDPIEDNPNHSWTDYRSNWENTLTASLFQPEVWRYEIVPWPERIFGPKGLYPATEPTTSAPTPARVPIPKTYETELQSVFHALGDMKQPEQAIHWDATGTAGIGVLVSDTMMFQRHGAAMSDPALGSFYGLALPLLMHGMPIEPVQIESASPEFLKKYRVLLLTYEGQKPPTEAFHKTLAAWVRGGGALVVVDDNKDPYAKVREWWNTSPYHDATPLDDLLRQLNVSPEMDGMQHVGRGVVVRAHLSPAALTYKADGAQTLRELTHKATDAIGLPWKETNALVLRRGPYVIAAGLDEPSQTSAPATLHGTYINLFDSNLAELSSVKIAPKTRYFLVNVDAIDSSKPEIIAAACKISGERSSKEELSFRAEGIDQTHAVVRIKAPYAARSVRVDGKELDAADFAYSGHTLLLRFTNTATPVLVTVTF